MSIESTRLPIKFVPPFRIEINNAGYVAAIVDAHGCFVCHLHPGTIRNEAEGGAGYVLGLMNAAAAFDFRSMSKPNEIDGPCYYCGMKTNSLGGDPREWPVMLCHPDDPGVAKHHHQGCVCDRLHPSTTGEDGSFARGEIALIVMEAEKDGKWGAAIEKMASLVVSGYMEGRDAARARQEKTEMRPNETLAREIVEYVVRESGGDMVLDGVVKHVASLLSASRADAVRPFVEALAISPDDCGRIMHESWMRTKFAHGFHRRPPDSAAAREHNCPCDKCHADLIPWDELPERQKDINRHAFDDVLAEIRRRAALDVKENQ